MNSLEMHNQVSANVNRLFRTHRSNDVKTMQHIDMIEKKQDKSKQINIDEALDNLRVGNYVKGTMIDMLA